MPDPASASKDSEEALKKIAADAQSAQPAVSAPDPSRVSRPNTQPMTSIQRGGGKSSADYKVGGNSLASSVSDLSMQAVDVIHENNAGATALSSLAPVPVSNMAANALILTSQAAHAIDTSDEKTKAVTDSDIASQNNRRQDAMSRMWEASAEHHTADKADPDARGDAASKRFRAVGSYVGRDKVQYNMQQNAERQRQSVQQMSEETTLGELSPVERAEGTQITDDMRAGGSKKGYVSRMAESLNPMSARPVGSSVKLNDDFKSQLSANQSELADLKTTGVFNKHQRAQLGFRGYTEEEAKAKEGFRQQQTDLDAKRSARGRKYGLSGEYTLNDDERAKYDDAREQVKGVDTFVKSAQDAAVAEHDKQRDALVKAGKSRLKFFSDHRSEQEIKDHEDVSTKRQALLDQAKTAHDERLKSLTEERDKLGDSEDDVARKQTIDTEMKSFSGNHMSALSKVDQRRFNVLDRVHGFGEQYKKTGMTMEEQLKLADVETKKGRIQRDKNYGLSKELRAHRATHAATVAELKHVKTTGLSTADQKSYDQAEAQVQDLKATRDSGLDATQRARQAELNQKNKELYATAAKDDAFVQRHTGQVVDKHGRAGGLVDNATAKDLTVTEDEQKALSRNETAEAVHRVTKVIGGSSQDAAESLKSGKGTDASLTAGFGLVKGAVSAVPLGKAIVGGVDATNSVAQGLANVVGAATSDSAQKAITKQAQQSLEKSSFSDQSIQAQEVYNKGLDHSGNSREAFKGSTLGGIVSIGSGLASGLSAAFGPEEKPEDKKPAYQGVAETYATEKAPEVLSSLMAPSEPTVASPEETVDTSTPALNVSTATKPADGLDPMSVKSPEAIKTPEKIHETLSNGEKPGIAEPQKEPEEELGWWGSIKRMASNAWSGAKQAASNAWSGVKNFFGYGS